MQAAAPSQTPVLPHVLSASCGHSSSGSVPVGTGSQTPSAPPPLRGAAHARQGAGHESSQQKPSRHTLLAHAVAPVQGDPQSFAWNTSAVLLCTPPVTRIRAAPPVSDRRVAVACALPSTRFAATSHVFFVGLK